MNTGRFTSERMRGVKFTEEHKRKIGAANAISRKGMKLSAQHKKNIGLSVTGIKHGNWKGENAGYVPIHMWVARHKGKPTKCEHCGKDGLTGKHIHWANKDGKYKRNLDDYMRLCVSCHRKYDIDNNGYRTWPEGLYFNRWIGKFVCSN